jgi:hypothetical protein
VGGFSFLLSDPKKWAEISAGVSPQPIFRHLKFLVYRKREFYLNRAMLNNSWVFVSRRFVLEIPLLIGAIVCAYACFILDKKN